MVEVGFAVELVGNTLLPKNKEIWMVVGTTILIDDRGLRIVAHNGGAHDVSRTAIDHRIGCVRPASRDQSHLVDQK